MSDQETIAALRAELEEARKENAVWKAAHDEHDCTKDLQFILMRADRDAALLLVSELRKALEKKYSCQNCGHTANLSTEALSHPLVQEYLKKSNSMKPQQAEGKR